MLIIKIKLSNPGGSDTIYVKAESIPDAIEIVKAGLTNYSSDEIVSAKVLCPEADLWIKRN